MARCLVEYQTVIASGAEDAHYDLAEKRQEFDRSIARPLDDDRARAATLEEVRAG